MKKAYIYAFLSIFLWSTVATTGKLLLGSFTDVQILCVSSLLAAVALLIINLFFRKGAFRAGYRVKDYLHMILIGMPGIFFYYIFYYAGTARLLASQAFCINYMWPIMSIVFACLLLKEKLTVRKVIAIALSFVGVLFVAGPELLLFDKQSALGVLLCLGAAVCYGLFSALNKKATYDSSFAMMVNFFAAFALSGLILLVQQDAFSLTLPDVLGFIWNGAFTMAIPNTLWILALRKGDTAKISNLAYITPFLSMVWTTLFLREQSSILSLIGLVIMVGGILVQLKDGKEKKAA